MLAQVQQPQEPFDPSPSNGETYYLINQLSDLQIDLNNNSTVAGDEILQNTRSFSSLSQRWAMTKSPDGTWKISNIFSGLCLDSTGRNNASTVQNLCDAGVTTQEWIFTYTSNGYNSIRNVGTGDLLDVVGSSKTAGARLVQMPLRSRPTASQLWLFRTAFWRRDDVSTAEKEEYDRATPAQKCRESALVA